MALTTRSERSGSGASVSTTYPSKHCAGSARVPRLAIGEVTLGRSWWGPLAIDAPVFR
ncbi:hypothetical protein MMEU_3893 [Mycobacterium marinum str. Europe]|nr:hypothetical protein MMEU_3893 [Mycobacterium marinum str. Europe]